MSVPHSSPRHDPAPPYRPLYLLMLLESQLLARQAIRRMEALSERYPDPDLRDAIERLCRAEEAEQQ